MRNHPLDGIERQKLTIRDINVLRLSYVDPTGNLWRTGSYQVWKTDGAITQIFTEEGLVGIGEGTPYSNPADIKQYTEETIRKKHPHLIGKNPFDVEFLANRGQESRHARAPWAGVEAACWDLIGKATGKPVYELLCTEGEPQREIKIYASAGVEHERYADGAEFLIEEALRYKEAGYDAFKFRPGTDWAHVEMTLGRYVPILQRLREAVGPEFRLMHEALGMSLGSLETIIGEFAPVLEDLGFYWFEEAFGGTDLEHIDLFVRLKEAMPTVKVSGGERFQSRFESQVWLDRGALDIVQSDCNVTGVLEN